MITRPRKLVSAQHRGYALAVVLALIAPAACGVSDVRPEEETAGMVTGVVIGDNDRPLPAQIVDLAGRQAETDADGRFTLLAPAGLYDLAIVTPDRTLVTIYLRLSRREPVLRHRATAPAGRPMRMARLSGSLSGGGPYPLRTTMHVGFVSAHADADVILGGLDPAAPRGPAWGPMTIVWEGPPRLEGDLMALQIGEKNGGAGPTWFARTKVVLGDNENVAVALTMQRVPAVRRAAVAIRFEADEEDAPTVVQRFGLGGRGVVFTGNGPAGSPQRPLSRTCAPTTNTRRRTPAST